MFKAIRSRIHLTPSTAVATIALVFAMTGGAYAAKRYLITSTKQISPAVLKALTGKPGPAGPAGATGAAGSQGSAGASGPAGGKGETGSAGATGPQGPEGPRGSQGAEGKAGSPWTAGGFLPKGATETGTWGVHLPAGVSEAHNIIEPISFAIPLETTLGTHAEDPAFYLLEGQTVAKTCEGTAANPTAAEGYLCVYQGAINEVEQHDLGEIIVTPELNGGVAKAGDVLDFFYEKGGPLGPEAFVTGSWAVTAP